MLTNIAIIIIRGTYSMSIKEPKVRDLYLYDQINFHTGVGLDISKSIDEINTTDSEIRKSLLAEYGSVYTPPPILLNINSGGGSVYTGLGLIDKIRLSKAPVHTKVCGLAASMAAGILMCGKVRTATTNSTIMIHQVSSIAWGDITTMEEDVTEAKRLNDVLFDIILQTTKIKKADLNAIKKQKKDWFLTAQEALKLGVIDAIEA
jgi:ATP-dependent Clp protease protease subunit